MRTREQILSAIAGERDRQAAPKNYGGEGYDAQHDDNYDHRHGELAQAAACYAIPPTARRQPAWPSTWLRRHDKRKKHSRLRQLEIAAALLVAEIERLERIEFRFGS
jgi:hypothetical protein